MAPKSWASSTDCASRRSWSLTLSQKPDATPAFASRAARRPSRPGGRDVRGGQPTATPGLRHRRPQSHHHPIRRDRPDEGILHAERSTYPVDPGPAGSGQGIERVIETMRSLNDLPGRPRYLVVGRTHPKVLAADGEAYRNARIDQALRSGVADSVCFDTDCRNVPMLSALFQSAAVVVVPYDSTDQVSSSALVDAIASGRPVVATAFPHAVELLASGAGIVVAHDDPDALACALRRVLTEPRLAGAMAAEARRLAPEMAWPTVARAYLRLAHRVLAQRRARA